LLYVFAVRLRRRRIFFADLCTGTLFEKKAPQARVPLLLIPGWVSRLAQIQPCFLLEIGENMLARRSYGR
jgi:hypothetical protein